jgi:hypothetical protein
MRFRQIGIALQNPADVRLDLLRTVGEDLRRSQQLNLKNKSCLFGKHQSYKFLLLVCGYCKIENSQQTYVINAFHLQ